MKVIYKVMVRIRAGYDDTMDQEYNGVDPYHNFVNEADAKKCLKKAQQDVNCNNRLLLAYIDRIEVY